MDFLILPHQLFNKKYLDKENNYIIYEHPQYFKKYNFNKKKLVLHRASMKYYYDYLKDNNFKVKYFNFDERPKLEEYLLFDPVDKVKLYGEYTFLDTPNFLLNKELIEKYRDKTDKFLFTNFYMWSKKELDIYPKLKSKDSMNRKRFKDDIEIPDLPSNKSDEEYIKPAINYVNKHFKNNYGNTDNFIYPVKHSTAKRWVNDFIKKRFEYFGPYQDFVKKDENFMFHSILSSSINIGLINPLEIIDEIGEVKSKIPINSFEGYLRQLFWREYQRYTYIYADFDRNYFGNRKKLTKDWYEGTLGIEPVDDLIKSGFETAYMHHIGRLMFVGNFMNLSGISPKEGFKWFMEFSIDSYEWVMHQNVLDMVFFVTAGQTMRKPYISSSNYILKMSEYKKGEWSEKWNELYNKFLKKNKKKLWKFRYSFPTLKNM
uniref:Deoxyribodipyrimidine photo-lyase-related protein n=1 Tax=Megaviridae environmental sample TaxID=1737588 RepID=A0A5J6VLE0_9VIRU|nr:MAG: deoxyribodipyrimidine photo-lyase-related protein [Megaviridae environmental sample]